MSDALARAADVLGAHQRWASHTCLCGASVGSTGQTADVRDSLFAAHQAQMLADAGLLAESAPVAGGNGAVAAEPCPPRPLTHETLDSLTARLVAARAATDGYRAEAERLRELLDEAHAKIERMEEL